MFLLFFLQGTVKPVLSGHLKIDITKVVIETDILMEVESIADLEHSGILLTSVKR